MVMVLIVSGWIVVVWLVSSRLLVRVMLMVFMCGRWEEGVFLVEVDMVVIFWEWYVRCVGWMLFEGDGNERKKCGMG